MRPAAGGVSDAMSAQWEEGNTSVSNGQVAQKGTSAMKCSLAWTIRSWSRNSKAA